MNEYDEEGLIIESEAHCQTFLKREYRSLVTYTRDATIQYVPQPNITKLNFSPRERTLYLPLDRFLDEEIDANLMLFHIYYELALYPDWKKQPAAYLNRLERWQQEINQMTAFFVRRLQTEEVAIQNKYSANYLKKYIEKEMSQFLFSFDRYLALLIVLQRCPIYRSTIEMQKIKRYFLTQDYAELQMKKLSPHQQFAKSFLCERCGISNTNFEAIFKLPVIFGQPFYTFLSSEIRLQLVQSIDVFQIETLIKSFIYPEFERIWQADIMKMSFTLDNEGSGSKEGELERKESSEDLDETEKKESMESSSEEEQEILAELLEDEQENQLLKNEILGEQIRFETFDVSPKELKSFQNYAAEVAPQRQELQRFWQQMIGEAKKEESIKKDQQLKGLLDVNSVIHHYVALDEAEQTGNYKNLPIFSRYLLETQAKKLPEAIRIALVIDNSGSMNAEKIEIARETVAVTLLSLEDFNRYLEQSTVKLNQRVQLQTQTWLFGSQFYQVKPFALADQKEMQSKIIKSVTLLNGEDGATDDASCFKQILADLTAQDKLKIQRGELVYFVFEVTDGASSFPGAAKEAITDLLECGIEIFSFQIGKPNQQNEKTFDFVWNQGFSFPRGIDVGEEIQKLPRLMTDMIGYQLKQIFH
ncbi:vWA domain-containing protein [Vagococcus silagei]|uniref:VWA domain-containing protein n=1 Tax=Vagococcus silagei TaxID=2508885 RepID=A0A4S3B5C2_9ENTE|nr:vWA domain-containing protein [Vagococcus silagei]THB61718.1 VWA domain-containing protein [Vagococcus silagei]